MGPDHSGAPAHFARPGEPGLISHPHALPKVTSGMQDQTNVKADLGVRPKVKHAHLIAAPIHDGMMAKSRKDGTHFSGLSGQDLSRYDANGPDPLAGPPRGKRLTPVQINPGSRSRNADSLASEEAGVAHARAKASDQSALHAALGKAIISEALAHSSVDDRRYGIGALPPATEES